MAKLTQRVRRRGDAPIFTDRIECSAEGIEAFPNRIGFDDFWAGLIRHGDKPCLRGCEVLEMEEMEGTEGRVSWRMVCAELSA
jgi:hypothetical protein